MLTFNDNIHVNTFNKVYNINISSENLKTLIYHRFDKQFPNNYV